MLSFIKQHKKGILGTVIFHSILALLFIFFGFSTPLPLPAEQGILINFGNTQQASGSREIEQSVVKTEPAESQPQQNRQEQTNTRQPQPVQNQASNPQQSKEDLSTQDFEEAPEMDTKQQKQQTSQVTEEKVDEQQQKQQKKEKKQPQQKVDKKALYPGKSSNESGQSEGKTEGSGNQGRESGSPDADNYADMESRGMGGVDFSLQGRNPESLPKPQYNYQVEGKVVVEITVDKYGTVTKANAGAKGSTTLNDKLLQAARKAALNAKFDRKPDAPAYQKGTITYYFRLQ